MGTETEMFVNDNHHHHHCLFQTQGP